MLVASVCFLSLDISTPGTATWVRYLASCRWGVSHPMLLQGEWDTPELKELVVLSIQNLREWPRDKDSTIHGPSPGLFWSGKDMERVNQIATLQKSSCSKCQTPHSAARLLSSMLIVPLHAYPEETGHRQVKDCTYRDPFQAHKQFQCGSWKSCFAQEVHSGLHQSQTIKGVST